MIIRVQKMVEFEVDAPSYREAREAIDRLLREGEPIPIGSYTIILRKPTAGSRFTEELAAMIPEPLSQAESQARQAEAGWKEKDLPPE